MITKLTKKIMNDVESEIKDAWINCLRGPFNNIDVYINMNDGEVRSLLEAPNSWFACDNWIQLCRVTSYGAQEELDAAFSMNYYDNYNDEEKEDDEKMEKDREKSDEEYIEWALDDGDSAIWGDIYRAYEIIDKEIINNQKN